MATPEQTLPSYFESKRDWGDKDSGMVPLLYKHGDGNFLINDIAVQTADFNPYRIFEHLIEGSGIDPKDSNFQFPEGIPIDEMFDHPLFIGTTMATLISGPALSKYVVDNRKKVLDEVPKVIKEVFDAINPQLSEVDPGSFRGSMGFDARIDQEYNLTLQTFGSCACMGVDPHGLFIREGVENGFSTYGLHNNDALTQTVSLIAGLGHIADLASQDS